MPPNAQVLTPHDVRRIAVAASVHPKTVTRAYRGADVRSTCAARIAEAARALGLPLPPRAAAFGGNPLLSLVSAAKDENE